jgi:hypothetical protein
MIATFNGIELENFAKMLLAIANQNSGFLI